MAKIKQNLGSISKCDVKDVWSLETDFSDWLSESKNLQALCDTLGIEPFDTMERESSVGAYRADIVGTLANGRHVIIENQWGKTNHDHLGKVITYASGKDASVIIWIAESYDDEHSSAIEWLNNISNDTWFFLVMIELIRIGDSEPAPLFNVIQRPNNYIQMQNASLSDTDRVRYEFWGGFIDYASNSKLLKSTLQGVEDRPKMPYTYYAFSKGCTGFEIHIMLSMKNQKRQSVAARIWISDNKALYNHLFEFKAEIESELGLEMVWRNMDGNKSCSITCEHVLKKDDDDMFCYRWFEDITSRMKATFNKYAEDF